MADIGSFLFIPAIILTFFYRRIAAGIALMAALLCLPLYLYSWLRVHSVGFLRESIRSHFEPISFGTNWAIAGIASLLFAIIVCLRSFIAAAPKIDPMRESSESG